jgi:hypothetical protein
MIKASHIIESLLVLNERNVANVWEIEDFINKLSRTARVPEVKKWMKSTLRSYMINQHPSFHLVTKEQLTKTNKYFYDNFYEPWMDDALKRGEDIYMIFWSIEFENQIRHVIDYFNYLFNPQNELPRELQVRDLTRMSVPDAIDKSEEWTKWLNKSGTSASDSGTKEVMNAGEGFKWVQVLSPEALNYEGREMQHCAGSYATKVEHDRCQIYSLRDSTNHPHVTIEARGDNVVQIKGKQNKEVVEKYRDYVAEFLTEMKFNVKDTYDLENIGMFYFRGKVVRDPEPIGYMELVKSYSSNQGWYEILSPKASDYVNKQVKFHLRRPTDIYKAYALIYNKERISVALQVENGKVTDVKSGDFSTVESATGLIIDFMKEMNIGVSSKNIAELLGGIYYKGELYPNEDALPSEYWSEHGWSSIFEVPSRKLWADYENMELPSYETVEDFLEKGVDPDAVLDNGMTAIILITNVIGYQSDHPGTHRKGRKLIELLLNYGADINTKDHAGCSALRYAVLDSSEEAEDFIEWFIDHGADKESKDNAGETPLEATLSVESVWNAVTLIRNGAHATEDDKERLIDIAKSLYEEETVQTIADQIGYDYLPGYEDD